MSLRLLLDNPTNYSTTRSLFAVLIFLRNFAGRQLMLARSRSKIRGSFCDCRVRMRACNYALWEFKETGIKLLSPIRLAMQEDG